MSRATGDDALCMEKAGVKERGEETDGSGRDMADLLVAGVVDTDGIGVVLGSVSVGRAT